MKNYGIDLEKELREQTEEDWIFGSASDACLALITEFERQKYLPQGEVQRSDVDDMSDCATRAPINTLEAKFTYLYQNNKLLPENRAWLETNGYVVDNRIVFADALPAIKSGTTREGNSFRAPLEAIRKFGLVPKKLLPLESWMTWEQYHNPARITPAIEKLGLDFLRRFTINYERVYASDFKNILQTKDMVCGGVHAWSFPVNGEYPRTLDAFNHEIVLFKTPMAYIFDNYVDGVDGDFIKKLASDYRFVDFGYRVYISRENNPTITIPEPERTRLWWLLENAKQWLLSIQAGLRGVFGRLKGMFGIAARHEPIQPDEAIPPEAQKRSPK